MQTILGAGGAIGVELANELTNYTKDIRLVSRNPKKINKNDETVSADLTVPLQVKKAVEGSEIVYLSAGLPYKTKVWEAKWSIIMDSVIEACKHHNAKLVFFDNMYMYDAERLDDMTEDTIINPSSKKGKVRGEIAHKLIREIEAGNIRALIARAPDFIGPFNSLFSEMVIKKLMNGKKANWFASVDKIHNFIHTKDAAKATAILGNYDKAYGEVWHLPATTEKMTMKEWIDLAADEIGVKPKYSIMSKGLMNVLGLFVPILKEFKEMVYQYDRDYYFNSSKFNNKFDYVPMTAEESIKNVVAELKT